MKRIFLALLATFALASSSVAQGPGQYGGAYPGAKYGGQSDLLADLVFNAGAANLTGTGPRVCLQGTPTLYAPNFVGSGGTGEGYFAVDGVVFGQRATNYHQLLTPNSVAAIQLGNATDPTSYYNNTTHKFRNASLSGMAEFTLSGSNGRLTASQTNANLELRGNGTGKTDVGTAIATSLAATGALSGASVAATGAVTGASVAATGAISSSGATSGIGYTTGAGGAVTQATNKGTGVTLNTMSGTITMNNASLGSGIWASFTFTNSNISSTDVVLLALRSGGSVESYTYQIDSVNAGSCTVSIRNQTAGSLGEALVFNFAVIKAVNN